MKSFTNKITDFLLKQYPWGVALLIVSGIHAYSFKPKFFYPQATGVVIDIQENVYFYTERGNQRKRVVHIFNIDGVKYTAHKNDEYKTLVGKEVTYRWIEEGTLLGRDVRARVLSTGIRKHLVEVSCVESHGKSVTHTFIFSLVLFVLGLSWCGWALVLKWRSVP